MTLIAIHPSSSNPAKCWPKSCYQELISKLLRAGYEINLIGDEKSYQYNQDIINGSREKVENLAGKFSLSELTEYFTKCALLVSNDSGPIHLASVVKLPIVDIFGRNIPGVGPVRWGPYQTKSIVFHKDPGCSPCLDRDCPYKFKCLTAITPDEVFAAAKELLS